MKNLFLIFVVIIALTQLVFGTKLPVKNQDVSPKQLKSQNKEITKLVAIELSKDLPKKIDEYTKFTSIEAVDANLIYTFEINTGAKSDDSVRKEDKLRMKDGVTSGVCRSSKRFMDAQITITYIYISAKTKAKLFQFDIKQADCFKLYGIR